MEVGLGFYSPEYLWQWWKEEHLLCAAILPELYEFDAHNYFKDCILLLILYVEVNGLELSNFPRASQLVNAGATIQIEVFWFL